jgi:hypothetical protein
MEGTRSEMIARLEQEVREIGRDAFVWSNQCDALARRVTIGLARTETTGSHFSGDLFLACLYRQSGSDHARRRRPLRRSRWASGRAAVRPLGIPQPLLRGGGPGYRGVRGARMLRTRIWGTPDTRSPALPRDRVMELLRRRSGD